MTTIKAFLGAALLLGVQTAMASPIFYDVEDNGDGQWTYHYTVGNETGESIDWFTIFFDFDLYSMDLVSGPFGEEVDPATYDGPADWDLLVAPPDGLFPGDPDNQPGFYDGFAFGAPVGPGELLGGFSITFNWLGTGAPGSQPFTLFGDNLPFDLNGYTLFTQPLNAHAVPEPGTLTLLGAGLLGLMGVRRRRKAA